MLVGIARGSSRGTLESQRKALVKQGCERIVEERLGLEGEGHGLTRAFSELRRGDTVVVSRLDRLGGSVREVVGRVEWLRRRGVGLRSLSEKLDSECAKSAGVFRGFRMLAEAEQALRRERAQLRSRAVKERGQPRGRRKRLAAAQRARAVELYQSREHTVKEICALMGVSRSTLYTYVNEQAELVEDGGVE